MKSLLYKFKQLVSFRRNPVIYMDPALSHALQSTETVSPAQTTAPAKPHTKVKKVGDITISFFGKDLVLTIKKELTPRTNAKIKPPVKKPSFLRKMRLFKRSASISHTENPHAKPFTFLDTVGVGVISLLVVFLVIANYTPQTFLTGWDTLHPEFNLPLAFQQALLGVWRTDQGLGAVAAHSHMSEIPRLLFLAAANLVLPVSALRYAFFFFCLLIGPIGVFLVSRAIIPSKNTQVVTLASIVSAVAYLLNLTVLQHFYVPFEMFAAAYASVPFLLLFSSKYFEQGSRRYVLALAVTSFFAAPMAYAATLFYAWFLFLLLFVFSQLALKKFRFRFVKRAVIVGLVVFCTNAFWMIPNWYSVLSQSTQIKESSINQMFTPEAYLHNVSYGEIGNVLIGKSYLFQWREFDAQSNEFKGLLDEWNTHLADSRVTAVLYLLAALSITGLILGLIKRNTFVISTVLPFLGMLFFLMTENGPLGGIFVWVQNHIGLMNEALRNPFTKFSIPFLLLMSVYLGFAVASIIRLVGNSLAIKVTRLLITVLFIGLIAFSMKPAFDGNLISPSMRVSIPSEYFKLFSWFKDYPDVRVAKFPVNSMWGWEYTNWGYQGAGFMWFGINNPLLVRDFDRWNADNETFYSEISRALYTNNDTMFNAALQKYQVGFLVVDQSIINAGTNDKLLYNDELSVMMKKLQYKEVATFGFLSVYQTPFGVDSVSSVPAYIETQTDSTYLPFTLSASTVQKDTGVVQPFVNLDPRAGTAINLRDGIVITPAEFTNQKYTINVPDYMSTEDNVTVSVEIEKSDLLTIILRLIIPEITVDGKVLPLDDAYIKYEVNALDAGFISLGDYVFDIRNAKDGTVGIATLNATTTNRLAVYSEEKTINPTYSKEISNKQASWCRQDARAVATTPLTDGFSFEVEDESVCIGNGFTATGSVLSSVMYQTVGTISPFFCINQAGVDGCLNRSVPILSGEFGRRGYETITPLTKGDYWFAFVAQSSDRKTTAGYQGISVGSYKALKEFNVNFKSAFQPFTTALTFEEVTGSKISLRMPAAPIVSENFGLKRGQPEATNCDIDKSGTVEKKATLDSVSYAADNNGVSCDYFSYPALSFNTSYLMNVTGVNAKGRSIKYYLENTSTGRMDQERLLPSSSFNSFYPVYATGDKPARGYVVNLETRAFGGVESSNTLSNLSFYALPYEWLSGIRLTPAGDVSKTSDLIVNAVDTSGLGIKASVTSTTGGVVTLNEAYDAGWIALSGRALLPHTTVNGWQNGWEVPAGDVTITIFYLPNLFQVLGYSLIVGFLVPLFVLTRKPN